MNLVEVRERRLNWVSKAVPYDFNKDMDGWFAYNKLLPGGIKHSTTHDFDGNLIQYSFYTDDNDNEVIVKAMYKDQWYLCPLYYSMWKRSKKRAAL